MLSQWNPALRLRTEMRRRNALQYARSAFETYKCRHTNVLLLSMTNSPGKNSSSSTCKTGSTSVDGIFSCTLPSCQVTFNNFEVESTSTQTRSPGTSRTGTWYRFFFRLICRLFLAVCPRAAAIAPWCLDSLLRLPALAAVGWRASRMLPWSLSSSSADSSVHVESLSPSLSSSWK